MIEAFGDGTAWAVGTTFARAETSLPGLPTYSFFGHMDATLNMFYTTGGYNLDPTAISGGSEAPPAPTSFYVSEDYNTISGTAIMGPSMTCHWYGSTSISNPSYRWIVDGDVIGTNSDVEYTAGGNSFTLELHVTDSETGAFAYKSMDIVVTQGAEQCWDQ